jgi:hypothetical protein
MEQPIGFFLYQSFVPHCTEARFARLLSVGFTTMALGNPLERKLGKRTSVHCVKVQKYNREK